MYVRIWCRSTAFLWQRSLTQLWGRNSSSSTFSTQDAECTLSRTVIPPNRGQIGIEQILSPYTALVLGGRNTCLTSPQVYIKARSKYSFLLEFSAAIQLLPYMLVVTQMKEESWCTTCLAFVASCFVHLAEERRLAFDIPELLLIIFK